MKKEALRMDRVTYIERGITLLDNFDFQMFTGEVMGLIPLDSLGLDAFIQLLQGNRTILYGYVYLKEKLVNTYSGDNHTNNNVQVISNESNLVDYMSAAENVFTLRRGYKGLLISSRILRQQLQMILRELDISIPADIEPPKLSLFERYVIEIVKAVVSSPDIIVLQDPSSVINPDDLGKLHKVLRYYADKGYTFIYISVHREELAQVCDRISLMAGGRIVKVVEQDRLTEALMMHYAVSGVSVQKNNAGEETGHAENVFWCENLYCNKIRGLSFSVGKGECLAIHDHGNLICEDLIDIISGEKQAEGRIGWTGQHDGSGGKRRVAVILENPVDTMLFNNMTYADNLCITMDHRLTGMWRRGRARKNIAREMMDEGLPDIQMQVKYMSMNQKYQLIYTRILLQRPEVVFCIHPYLNVDIELREYIQSLMQMLLDRGIAIVIIVVNFQDTLQLADRLLVVRDGTNQGVLTRNEFEHLLKSTKHLQKGL